MALQRIFFFQNAPPCLYPGSTPAHRKSKPDLSRKISSTFFLFFKENVSHQATGGSGLHKKWKQFYSPLWNPLIKQRHPPPPPSLPHQSSSCSLPYPVTHNRLLQVHFLFQTLTLAFLSLHNIWRTHLSHMSIPLSSCRYSITQHSAPHNILGLSAFSWNNYVNKVAPDNGTKPH